MPGFFVIGTVNLLNIISTYIEAIHRYYESRRRLFNDEQPGRKDIALKAKREAKKQEKRKRVCDYLALSFPSLCKGRGVGINCH